MCKVSNMELFKMTFKPIKRKDIQGVKYFKISIKTYLRIALE